MENKITDIAPALKEQNKTSLLTMKAIRELAKEKVSDKKKEISSKIENFPKLVKETFKPGNLMKNAGLMMGDGGMPLLSMLGEKLNVFSDSVKDKKEEIKNRETSTNISNEDNISNLSTTVNENDISNKVSDIHEAVTNNSKIVNNSTEENNTSKVINKSEKENNDSDTVSKTSNIFSKFSSSKENNDSKVVNKEDFREETYNDNILSNSTKQTVALEKMAGMLGVKGEEKDDDESGFLAKMFGATKIGKMLGKTKIGKSLTKFGGTILTSITGMFATIATTFTTALSSVGSSIAGIVSAAPAALLAGVAGVVWALVDGVRGMFKFGGISGFFGGMLGGLDSGVSGMFKGAGKWALIGAGLGSVVPVIGTIIGGALGAVLGGILGFFGGEKISKALKSFGSFLSNGIGEIWQGFKDMISFAIAKVKFYINPLNWGKSFDESDEALAIKSDIAKREKEKKDVQIAEQEKSKLEKEKTVINKETLKKEVTDVKTISTENDNINQLSTTTDDRNSVTTSINNEKLSKDEQIRLKVSEIAKIDKKDLSKMLATESLNSLNDSKMINSVSNKNLISEESTSKLLLNSKTNETTNETKLNTSQSKAIDEVANMNVTAGKDNGSFSLLNVPKIHNSTVVVNEGGKSDETKVDNNIKELSTSAVFKNKISENNLQQSSTNAQQIIQQAAPITNNVITDNSSPIAVNSGDMRISNDDSSLYRRF